MKNKRLYRSESNRMLCGVCAGIAEYFEIDPTLIRLVGAFLCLCGLFPALSGYLSAAVVIPLPPENL